MPLNAAWHEAYEERAAIMEYCAHLPRKEAEAKARRTMPPPEPPPGKASRQYREFVKFWHNQGDQHAE